MTSTYRLQIRGHVTLASARALVGYLDDLGISHLYASPLLQSRTGSLHGYDVVDPNVVDPAIGGREELDRLAAELHARGMGLLLDVVPNHMTADLENRAFADVLAHGPASRFAEWFDIDWQLRPGRSHARLILPTLGEGHERSARAGRLRLVLEDGSLRMRYYDRDFPLDPATWGAVLGPAAARMSARPDKFALRSIVRALDAMPPRFAMHATSRMQRARAAADAEAALARLMTGSKDAREAVEHVLGAFSRGRAGLRRLERFLESQAYRLGYWRQAKRKLNYRRFFSIDELIALRTEDAAVFAASHSLILELVSAGTVDGLRIDHVDGLLEPGVYLARLRRSIQHRIGRERARAFPIVVEKILGHGEHVPPYWKIAGTTGYEFIQQVEDLFLDPRGVDVLTRAWAASVELPADFDVVARAEKRRALDDLLTADVARLVGLLATTTVRRGDAAGPSAAALARAVVETIARLRVYRAYLGADALRLSASGRARLLAALEASRHVPGVRRSALVRLTQALQCGELRLGAAAARRTAYFIKRFGQVSGPAAAKGVEDGAFYVHVPLLARNEVGSAPGVPARGALRRFHGENARRARLHPLNLLAATTHDTKRSTDVRARLAVLTEVAEDWTAAVRRWRLWNAPHRGAAGRAIVDANSEYVFYQSLVGIWPVTDDRGARYGIPSRAALDGLATRLHAYMEKAAREAGRMTSWLAPNPAFERGLHGFIDGALRRGEAVADPRFIRDVTAFVARIARPGFWSALSRLVLEIASAGVADVYQGEEAWSLTLVDPDNRVPVQFDRVAARLDALKSGFRGERRRKRLLRSMVERVEDGRLKLHVLHRGLQLRRRCPELFTSGEYLPLEVRGAGADHVIAFARRSGKTVAVAAAVRLGLTLTGDAMVDPTGAERWAATDISLPALGRSTFGSLVTGERLKADVRDGALALPCAHLFAEVPFDLMLLQ